MPICLDSLTKSVQSVSEELRKTVEIVICDNCSNDGTFELANEFRCECTLRVLQPPAHFENRTENWHFGLSHARGAWIIMLHCDDRMALNGIANILKICKSHTLTDVVMLSGRHRVFSDDTPPGRLFPIWPLPSLISGHKLREQILLRHCPFVPFQVMKRVIYEKIGGLDFKYELVQDWDLWIRLLAEGEVYYTGFHFGDWRVHEISGRYARTFAREHLELVSDIRRLIPEMSNNTAWKALNEQIPRIRTWIPDTPILELTMGLSHQSVILECKEPDNREIYGILKRQRWAVACKLFLLRMLGSLRLLRVKFD